MRCGALRPLPLARRGDRAGAPSRLHWCPPSNRLGRQRRGAAPWGSGHCQFGARRCARRRAPLSPRCPPWLRPNDARARAVDELVGCRETSLSFSTAPSRTTKTPCREVKRALPSPSTDKDVTPVASRRSTRAGPFETRDGVGGCLTCQRLWPRLHRLARAHDEARGLSADTPSRWCRALRRRRGLPRPTRRPPSGVTVRLQMGCA